MGRMMRVPLWWPILWMFLAFMAGWAIRPAFGLTLTPISFTLPDAPGGIDSWQLFIDADGNPDTGYGFGHEFVVRTVLSDAYVIRWTGGPTIRDGWGEAIGRAPVSLPLTVTVYMPIGGAVPWRAEGYSAGNVVSLTTGRCASGSWDSRDDAAAVWCTTGPGVAPLVDCAIFDEDGDNDVDLMDFALRCRPKPASMFPQNEGVLYDWVTP